MQVPRPLGMQVVPREECLQLLATREIGRLAVSAPDGPMIFPVNYVLVESSLLIRTDGGTKLDAATMAMVAFEIDEVDPEGSWGWSVMVRGRASEVTDALDEHAELLQHVEVPSWAPGERSRLLRVAVRQVTGRCFGMSTPGLAVHPSSGIAVQPPVLTVVGRS